MCERSCHLSQVSEDELGSDKIRKGNCTAAEGPGMLPRALPRVGQAVNDMSTFPSDRCMPGAQDGAGLENRQLEQAAWG